MEKNIEEVVSYLIIFMSGTSYGRHVALGSVHNAYSEVLTYHLEKTIATHLNLP
jgi:hypothetical protein